MKKIMFSDKYGLTQAVLEGRKTQTRRIATRQQMLTILGFPKHADYNMDELAESCAISCAKSRFSPYEVGEEVAVAQSYSDIEQEFINHKIHEYPFSEFPFGEAPINAAGWKNKMFTKALFLPHRIKITNVRVERLQDISDDDCLKEGIVKYSCYGFPGGNIRNKYGTYIGWKTPKEAFADLIDKTCGKGTLDSNPWVFVYDFELVK